MPGMHEFSIAEAIASQVRRYAPETGHVREVEVRIGPLRGLEPDSLHMCWEAVTIDTPIAGSHLILDMRPWSITCAECGRRWSSPVPFTSCDCGNSAALPNGTDELDLIAIIVDDAEASA